MFLASHDVMMTS